MRARPNYVTFAGVNLSQVPMDYAGNTRRILSGMRKARMQGATIVGFAELDASGYGCESGFLFPWVEEEARATLRAVIEESANTGQVIVLGMPLIYERRLLNVAAVVANGKLLGFYAKQFLARSGRHYEPKWFKPWPKNKVGYVEFDGQMVPVGHMLFDIGGVRLGVIICQDAWERECPALPFAEAGMDILVIPNASHFGLGKVATRRRITGELSRSLGCTVAYVNKIGNESGAEIYDGDVWVYHCGELKGAARRLTFNQVQVTTTTISLDHGIGQAIGDPSDNLASGSEVHIVYDHDFTWQKITYAPPNIDLAEWENSAEFEHEEICRALALGSTDYLRKCGLEREFVCFSGGADSTLVVLNRYDATALLLQEQGFAGFVELFGHLQWVQDLAASHPAFRLEHEELVANPQIAESGYRAIMKEIMRAMFMPGDNSGEDAKESAQEFALATGITFSTRSIQGIHDAIFAFVEAEIGRTPTWERDNVARQNMIARSRGTAGWSLANFFNALLVPPSNMSEILVGYWTEGADNAGGADHIGGLRKTRLREYLKVRHTKGLDGLPPLDALKYVLKMAPSAQLAPPKDGKVQTDEGDLGPYEVRDRFHTLFFIDLVHPVQAFEILLTEFPQHSMETIYRSIDNVLRLFPTTHWKRIRLPISLRLEGHDLDHRGGLRWPVLSSNFRAERADLREHFESPTKASKVTR